MVPVASLLTVQPSPGRQDLSGKCIQDACRGFALKNEFAQNKLSALSCIFEI